jgi:hypothetical protein
LEKTKDAQIKALSTSFFKKFLKKTQILIKKTLREAYWFLAGRQLFPTSYIIPKRNKEFFTNDHGLKHISKALGTAIVAFGFLLFAMGIVPIVDQKDRLSNFLQKNTSKIVVSIEKIAGKVNGSKSFLGKLSNKIILREKRPPINVYEQQTIKSSSLKQYGGIISKTLIGVGEEIVYKTKLLAKEVKKDETSYGNKLTSFLVEIKKYSNKTLTMFINKTDNLIEQNCRIISRVGKGLKGYTKKMVIDRLNNMENWQRNNNQKFAQADNEIMEYKAKLYGQVKQATNDQLAQLKIDFGFIKNPLKRFISLFGQKDTRISKLEEKLIQLESRIDNVPGNEISSIQQNQEGLIVVPSVGDEEKQKKKLKDAFSDEVIVEPDKTGQSGIIKPVFKKQTDQKYIYMLVPINN